MPLLRYPLCVLLEAIVLLASSNLTYAQTPQPYPLAKCTDVEVLSLDLKRRIGDEVSPEQPARVLTPTPDKSSPPGLTRLFVTILGPILGNMDSPDLQLQTTCVAGHLELHATILRSADYQESTLKFAPWRPEIALTLTARRGATLTTRWKMLLTSDAEAHRSTLPGIPDTLFPIVLHAVLLPPHR